MRWLLLIFALLLPLEALRASDYEDALEAYRADRLKDSARILKGIVKKNPKESKAWLLLGASYYQNQELKKAKKAFEEGDVEDLTKDTAYAWGSTYLAAEEFKKAIKGFRLAAKQKDANRSYARYYLGVCYYELGQLSRARRHFEQVKVEGLPSALRSRRESYLAEIKKRQDVLLSPFLAQPVIGRDDGDIRGDGKGKGKDSVDGDGSLKEAANGALSVRFRPSASLVQAATSLENVGGGKDSGEVLAYRFGAGLQMGQGGNAATSGSLDLTLGKVGYSADLNQTQLVTLEGSTGNFISQVSSSQKEDAAYVSARPKLSFRVASAFGMEIGAQYNSYLPNSKTTNAWGQSQVDLALRSDAALNLGLDVSLQQPFDESLHKKANDMVVKAEIGKTFGDVTFRLGGQHWETNNPKFLSLDRFRYYYADPGIIYRVGFASENTAEAGLSFSLDETTLSLRFSNTQREAPNGELPNRLNTLDPIDLTAKTVQRLQTSLSIPFWDSFTLVGSGASNSLAGYRYSEIDAVTGDPIKDFETTAQQTFYAAAVVVSFADWIRVNASYSNTLNKYSGEGSNEPEFLRRNPDVVEDSSIIIELAKSF